MKLLNNTNKKIIDSGCHVQGIHLKPHKILTHMLFDFLILRVIFIGCGAAFDSSALSFRIKSGMTKEKLFSNLYYTLWGYQKFVK